MNIELRAIKHSKFASHETECFEATIYIDGKKAGKVWNDGQGGCHGYESRETHQRLIEHAKTLPPIHVKGLDEPLYPDADSVISDAFYTWDRRRTLEKMLRTRLAWRDKDGAIHECKPMPPDVLARFVELPVDKLKARMPESAKHPDALILNKVPFDAALDYIGQYADKINGITRGEVRHAA